MLILLSLRAIWAINQTEIDWSPHINQWTGTVKLLTGLPNRDIHFLDPDDQAKFWLSEIERIKEVENDARMAHGAAWMLNAPSYEFIARLGNENILTSFSVRDYSRSGVPSEYSNKFDEFEQLCRDECLRLINRAIELDPENKEYRRSKAQLLVPRFWIFDLEPRTKDWLQELDECCDYDPDNALYDYIAAAQLWEQSVEFGYDQGSTTLTVLDEKLSQEGNQRFQTGLTKPNFRMGNQIGSDTLYFLEQSSVRKENYSRSMKIQDGLLFMFGVSRFMRRFADIHEQNGEVEAAVEIYESGHRVANQTSEKGNVGTTLLSNQMTRAWGLSNLATLEKDGLKQPVEDVRETLQETKREILLMQEVSSRIEKKKSDLEEHVAQNTPAIVVYRTAPQIVIVCTLLFFLTWPISLRCATSEIDQTNDQVKLLIITIWIAGLTMSIKFFILTVSVPEFLVPTIKEDQSLLLELLKKDRTREFIALQWILAPGAIYGVFLSLAMLLIPAFLIALKSAQGNVKTLLRVQFFTWARFVQRSSWVAALVALICFLILTPFAAAVYEAEYQTYYPFMSKNENAWREVKRIREDVLNDTAKMKQIDQSVETQMLRYE